MILMKTVPVNCHFSLCYTWGSIDPKNHTPLYAKVMVIIKVSHPPSDGDRDYRSCPLK